MSDREADINDERIINELDAVLPGEIDRRNFLQGTAGMVGGMMLAGCTGGGGTPANQEFQDDTQAVFSSPWKKEPSWGVTHVAEGKGYWKRAGVPNVNGVAGNGSDTVIQQVGAGNKQMAVSSLTTAINFLPGTEGTDPLDVKIMALAKGRPLLSLIWRKDQMESKSDLAGKSVYLASGFAAASWPVYPQLAGVDPSKVSTQSGTETAGPVKLAENEVQAVWGSIDLLPEYQSAVDAELGVTPLTAFGPFYGYPIWVNSKWFEGMENNVEFVSHVLTGYFKAMKWALLNQEDYLTYLQQEVNPNLRTWKQESLVGQYQALCAQAVNPEMKDKGLGHFTTEGVQFSFENAGPPLVDNYDSLRSAKSFVDRRAFKQSEKVTFSDSEWQTLKNNAEPIWSMFAKAGDN